MGSLFCWVSTKLNLTKNGALNVTRKDSLSFMKRINDWIEIGEIKKDLKINLRSFV